MSEATRRAARVAELGFEAEELLYRSLAERHLVAGHSEVDFRKLSQPPGGLSCDRSTKRPCLPDVFNPRRPEETLIAEMAPSATLMREPIASRAEECFVVEPRPVPEPANDAHCEIRLFREQRGWDDDWRPGDTTKALVRAHLAKTMHLRPERYHLGSDGRWHREP